MHGIVRVVRRSADGWDTLADLGAIDISSPGQKLLPIAQGIEVPANGYFVLVVTDGEAPQPSLVTG